MPYRVTFAAQSLQGDKSAIQPEYRMRLKTENREFADCISPVKTVIASSTFYVEVVKSFRSTARNPVSVPLCWTYTVGVVIFSMARRFSVRYKSRPCPGLGNLPLFTCFMQRLLGWFRPVHNNSESLREVLAQSYCRASVLRTFQIKSPESPYDCLAHDIYNLSNYFRVFQWACRFPFAREWWL